MKTGVVLPRKVEALWFSFSLIALTEFTEAELVLNLLLCCREAMMTRSLLRLREQIVRAKQLAQEASFIAEELNKKTEYQVTLQIPAANLDANRKVR